MLINNRVNKYRGLTSSATVMLGLKPFEDTIYIDSVPVMDYKSGTDGFLYSRLSSKRKNMISVVQTTEWFFRLL